MSVTVTISPVRIASRQGPPWPLLYWISSIIMACALVEATVSTCPPRRRVTPTIEAPGVERAATSARRPSACSTLVVDSSSAVSSRRYSGIGTGTGWSGIGRHTPG
jgi:hypothetical protein